MPQTAPKGIIPRESCGPVTRLRFQQLPCHRALGIPELLILYFKDLQVEDLVNAALVCKGWSLYALDTLWRTAIIPVSILFDKLSWLARDEYNCAIRMVMTPHFVYWSRVLM